MEPPHGTKEQRDKLLQFPDLPCHSASGKCTPLTSHLSCSNVGISGNSAKCYAARNFSDRVVEYNGEEDDDDIIIVKLKNGCENNKLSDDSVMGLHNELENMCLSSTNTSLSALQPLVDAVSDQFNDHEINKNDPLARYYTKKNETNVSLRTQSTNNQNFKRFGKTLPSASTECSGAKTDGKLRDADADTAFLSEEVPEMLEEIGAVALLPLLAPDSQADSITSSFFELTNDYGPFPVCSPNPSACSKLIHDNANYVTTGFDCQTELTKSQQPLYNSFVLPFNSDRSSASGQWQQPPFLKSQSLDQFLEFALKSNLHHNDLFQTSELNKSQSTEMETQQTSTGNLSTGEVDLSKKKCCVSANSSGNLDNTSSVVARSVEFLPTSAPVPRTSIALKLQSVESRPIYPNVPYSPYASPYGSPRSNRRRPLRESRRISIEQTGSFLQLNQYKLMDQIGQGSYGLVKLAYSEEDSTHYAMKILSKRRLLRQAGLMRRGPKKSTSPLDRVYREIAVLKKLDHPNVVKLIEVLDDPIEDSLYLVFELVKLGEVLRIPTVKPLSEQRACSIFRDTLLGLEYLHYQRIIHADLKPGNLLLTECGHVKIADLGVCNEFFGEDATITNASTAGTPAFRAPETLKLEKHSYCGKAADIWALGATLYSLVYGNVPFVANSIPVLYEKIKSDPLAFPDTIQISDELRDCIKQMLTKDPSERIILPELKIHTWVTAGGDNSLPTEDENCRLVQVSEEDINSVVRSIPKLDTLILIKTMLKKHSFGNPFLKGVCGRASQSGVSRLERFVRAGRSNSAPGAYNSADRRFSGDNVLPSLSELSTSSNQEDS